ncbi:bifunctional folylpolyglutamate synthase/dihydrofolate synthase, partial [Patescibacteria group bacterium]|nr:bifunctional folylpolyglutamate synthase/dihydrofolate synthase [Patescibacteria group bacterium]
MKYEEAVSYLYRLRRTGIRLRLTHTQELLHRMGDPRKSFRSVHVGGTNGKGSVCSFIYSALLEAGLNA